MGKIITIAAQKGGVTKTTIAVNLAHALTLLGKKVVLLDLDSQGQCATRLGFDPTSSAFNFLSGQSYELIPALEGLYLIASNSSLIKTEQWGGERVSGAVERIRDLAKDYAYLIIDTPPAGIRQEIGLLVADTLIVPVLCESPSMEGVANILDLAESISHYQQLIIVPSNYDKRWPEHEYNVGILRERFGGGSILSPILRRLAMAEATAYGATCFNYDARKKDLQPIRDSYMDLATWVIETPEDALLGE